MKKNRSIFAVLFAVSVLFNACKGKEDVTPEKPIDGEWAIQTFFSIDGDTEPIDVFAFLSAFEPCLKAGTITFKSGSYDSFLPKDCVDEEGQSLRFFPENPTGTYTITEGNKLTINDGSFPYVGTYKFKSNNEFVFTVQEKDEQIVITFVRK